MVVILYINNDHCTSVAQLKGYFSDDLTPESDTYRDLLDYGRPLDDRPSGIAVWLREMDETELASRVESIDPNLNDSAFYKQLKAAITGIVEDTEGDPLKPMFEKCFSFEGMKCDVKDNEAKVTVSLKVLMSVNETYELSVSSNWGMRGMIINPYCHPEGKTSSFVFSFRKRPGKEVGEITVKADEKVLSSEILVNNKTSTDVFTVKGVSFKMILVEGGRFQMGEGSSRHEVEVDSFFIGETVVTYELWKTLMYADRVPQDYLLPVTCNWYDCQEFIKRLNQETGKQFRLPSETEWEFAARGGNKSNEYTYAGSNFLEDVGWYKKNAEQRIHPVSQKLSNELGLYDMSGNVSEWCQDLSRRNKQRRIARGGSIRCFEWLCRITSSCDCIPESKKFLIGFRLAL